MDALQALSRGRQRAAAGASSSQQCSTPSAVPLLGARAPPSSRAPAPRHRAGSHERHHHVLAAATPAAQHQGSKIMMQAFIGQWRAAAHWSRPVRSTLRTVCASSAQHSPTVSSSTEGLMMDLQPDGGNEQISSLPLDALEETAAISPAATDPALLLHVLPEPATSAAQQWWARAQTLTEPLLPALPPPTLCAMLLGCERLQLEAPCPKWLRACLDALVLGLERSSSTAIGSGKHATVAAAAATAVPPQLEAILGGLGASSAAVQQQDALDQLLPAALAAVTRWAPGNATQQLCVRAVAQLYPRVQRMQHRDLAHLVHTLASLHESGVLMPPPTSSATSTPPTPATGAAGAPRHTGSHASSFSSSPTSAAPPAPCDEPVTAHDGQAALMLAVMARAQQLPWGAAHMPELAELVSGASALAAPVPTAWLAACLRSATHGPCAAAAGPVTAARDMATSDVLRLCQGVLWYAARAAAAPACACLCSDDQEACVQPGWDVEEEQGCEVDASAPQQLRWSQCRSNSSSTATTTPGALGSHGPSKGGALSSPGAGVPLPLDEAAVWLLGWGTEFAGQVFSARARAGHMSVPHMLRAAVLLEAYDQAMATCTSAAASPAVPTAAPALPMSWTDNWATGAEADLPAVGAAAPPAVVTAAVAPPLCHALEAALAGCPAQDAGGALEQLLAHAGQLPTQTLQVAVCACINRLREETVMAQSQPVPLLLGMAAAWPELGAAHLQADVQMLLPALLAKSRPLLPSCQTEELVQVLSALAAMETQPPADWQAMYFATLRSRLSLLQADGLHCVLGAITHLNLMPDELWVNDLFTTSRKLLPHMQPGQVSDLLWTLGHLAPCMDWLWAPAYEHATSPRLAELSPVQLANTIKSLTGLSYRPTRGWMDSFLAAVQTRLFSPGAFQLCIVEPDDPTDKEQTVAEHMNARAKSAALAFASPPRLQMPAGASSSAPAGDITNNRAGYVSVDVLLTIVDGLTYARAQPRKEWLHDFLLACRCKLSLLDSAQLSSLLMYCATAAFRPSPDWCDDYLHALQATLPGSGVNDLVTHLALLNSLGVTPEAPFLDAWCGATRERLCLLLPSQLHQVLCCLAACGYTPNVSWMASAQTAVEHHARASLFEPSELLRCLVILDRMGANLAALLPTVYAPQLGAAGLRSADPAVLAQLAWMLQSAPQPPPASFLVEFVGAAQAALPSFSKAQLECLLSGLHAICVQLQQQHHNGYSAATAAAAATVVASGSPLASLSSAAGAALVGPGGEAPASQGPAVPALVSGFLLVAREWVV